MDEHNLTTRIMPEPEFEVILRTGDSVARHLVTAGDYSIGRSTMCALVTANPELEEEHAFVSVSAGGVRVKPSSASSDVRVGGEQVRQEHELGLPASFSLRNTQVEVSKIQSQRASAPISVQPKATPIDAEHYEIHGEIAAGGMGRVLDAEDLKLGRTVAMKVLHEREDAGLELEMRFVQEAEVMGWLEHPNIVPIHDFGRDSQGRPYYTMKRVRGETLQSVLNKIKSGDEATLQGWPLNRLLNVFLKVCDAMAFAHSKGVIHRDLKPENIMIGDFGEVLVMDWGLARLLADTGGGESTETPDVSSAEMTDPGGLTLDGSVIGTPQFMPPEQAAGRLEDIDSRSDIYSLGAILYAILTLKPPVSGKTVSDVLQQVQDGAITPPVDFKGSIWSPKGVPSSLSRVAMRALARRQTERYQEVELMAADVAAWQSGFSTSVENLGPMGELALWIRRNRTLSLAIGLAMFAILIISGSFTLRLNEERDAALQSADDARKAEREATEQRQAAEQSAQLANQRKVAAERAAAQATISLADAAYDRLEWPRAQALLDSVPKANHDSNWDYLARNLDTSLKTDTPLTPRPWRVCAHPTLPGVMGLASQNGYFELVHVPSGRRLLEIPRTGIYQTPAISPDAVLLVLVSQFPKMQVDLHQLSDGRRVKRFAIPKANVLHQVCFNRDSQRIFIASDNHLRAYDLDGNEKWSFRSPNAVFDLNSRGLPLVSVGSAVTLIDPESGKARRSFRALPGGKSSVALSPDGSSIVYADQKGMVHSVNATSGRIHFSKNWGHQRQIDLQFLSQGNAFATVVPLPWKGAAYSIRIYSAQNGAQIDILSGGTSQPDSFAVNLLDNVIVCPGENPKAWRVAYDPPIATVDYSMKNRLEGLSYYNVWAFLDSDTLLLRSRPDSKLKLFDIPTAKLHSATELFPSERLSSDPGLDINGPRNALVLEDRDTQKTNLFYTLFRQAEGGWKEGGRFRVTPTDLAPRNTVRLSPDGEKLLLADHVFIQVHDTRTGKVLMDLRKRRPATGGPSYFVDAVWLKSSRQILIAGFSGHRGSPKTKDWIVLWDLDQQAQIRAAPHATDISVMTASPDGRQCADAGADRNIRIRDVATLETRLEFRAHDDSIVALGWHPSKPVLVSGSINNELRFWNTETGEFLGEIGGLDQYPLQLRFSPDGKYLVAATTGHKLQIWEFEKLGKPRPPLPATTWTGPPNGDKPKSADNSTLTITHAGSGFRSAIAHPTKPGTFAVGGFDGSAHLLDAENGNLREIHPSSFAGNASAVAFSPDGSQLAIGDGRVVTIRSLHSGKRVDQFSVEGKYIISLLFSPDAATLVVGTRTFKPEFRNLKARTSIIHHEQYIAYDYLPDGKTVYGMDKSWVNLARLEIPKSQATQIFRLTGRLVTAALYDSNTRFLLSNAKGTVGSWNRNEKREDWRIETGLKEARVFPFEDWFVIFGQKSETLFEGQVRTLAAPSETNLHLQGFVAPHQRTAFCPQSGILLVVGNNEVKIWNIPELLQSAPTTQQ